VSSITEQVAGAGTAVGRYFNVVSFLPSILFVAYLFLLVRSGAWSGPVDFSGVLDGDWWKSAALLSLLAFAAAVVLHPLQFTLVRLLEGYWGTSPLGRDLAVLRLRYHRARVLHLARSVDAARDHLEKANGEEAGPGTSRATAETIAAGVVAAEGTRQREGYPPRLEHLLPTRLGNALRSHEVSAGQVYGLNVIATFPRIALLAPQPHVDYVQDQRLQVELAVRTTVLSILAVIATVVFMCWHGWWVLLALAPYASAYLCYRGATVAAGSYGTALAVLTELNRFALYEHLRLPMPKNTADERRRNARLMGALAHDSSVSLDYERPPAPYN
jgi:hypothetical protein